MKKYHQGFFIPQNKEKYIGNWKNIVYRSSLEYKFFKWCDLNPKIIKWGSEEIIIPYFNPFDKKIHRYFPDLYIELLKNNSIEKYIVEIKPFVKTQKPKFKNEKQFLNESKEYIINQLKWKYARKFAEENNMKFIIVTEKDIK